jgi:hypothetical protein
MRTLVVGTNKVKLAVYRETARHFGSTASCCQSCLFTRCHFAGTASVYTVMLRATRTLSQSNSLHQTAPPNVGTIHRFHVTVVTPVHRNFISQQGVKEYGALLE